MDTLRGEFEDAWAQFQTTNSLRLIPDTLESEWTRGRESYLAFLVRVDDTSAVAQLRDIVRRVEHIAGVEPYPEDYWHITIKGVGFEVPQAARAEEVPSSSIQRVADAAGSVFAAQTRFEARIGLAGAFPEVVFAEVWDSLSVRDLNRRLLDSIPGLIRYPFDGPTFLPHVSIARFTSNEGLPQLKEALSRLREEPPGPTFTVREVNLIRARLSESAPSFETIETYHLG